LQKSFEFAWRERSIKCATEKPTTAALGSGMDHTGVQQMQGAVYRGGKLDYDVAAGRKWSVEAETNSSSGNVAYFDA
jgi:hypothetical protein